MYKVSKNLMVALVNPSEEQTESRENQISAYNELVKLGVPVDTPRNESVIFKYSEENRGQWGTAVALSQTLREVLDNDAIKKRGQFLTERSKNELRKGLLYFHRTEED